MKDKIKKYILEDLASFSGDMALAQKAIDKTSEYEVIANLVVSMTTDEVRSALKKFLDEEIDKFLEEENDKFLDEEKDACYHKVKSRYKVWPSAYASGALVKCRKVGAKNWGNKSKK
jgi:hypothetical protein